MKKKILALALCTALVAIAVVGATLAYFTDTKSAENTFTVGNVKIKLDEAKVDKDGKIITGEAAGRTEVGQSYKILPGITVDKDPTVTNIGSNDAWIRVRVTVTGVKDIAEELITKHGQSYDLTNIFGGFDSTKWELVKKEITDKNNKFVYTYKYTTKLAPEANTGALFTTVTLPAEVTKSVPEFKIKVEADAIQATFDSWDAAFTAFDNQK